MLTHISVSPYGVTMSQWVNSLRLRQNGRHFPDDNLKCIFLNENVWISIKISPKFVPRGPINNIPALVQIMAWRRPGDKSLSEPMMVSLPTHICVTRPQWVNTLEPGIIDIVVNINAGNGLSLVWHQAITWTNDDFLPTGPWGINLRIGIRRSPPPPKKKKINTLRPRQNGCPIADSSVPTLG